MITQPFSFDWDIDGFQIMEQYEELCKQELVAAGIKDPFQQDNHMLSDEGLIYLDLVNRFQVDSFKPESTYWEMILVNSFRSFETEPFSDVLVISKHSASISRVLLPVERDFVAKSEWPMSIGGLYEHQMLSLYSGAYALTPEIWNRMEPWIQREYYSVRPVFESDISSDC